MGDVLSLLKDGTHGTHRDAESGPLLLSAKNIKNGTVQWDESDRRISEDEYNIIHSNFRLQKGDVLLTIVGSIGEVAILSQSEGVTFQRSVAFLRPSDEICSEFLYSEIQGQKFQKELNDRKSTSAQPGMYLGDLGAIPIEFPTSDEEQMQIGSYFSTIDHLITLHQRKIYIFIKKMPIDWEQRKLGEVLKERTKRAQGGEELLSVTIANGVIRQADSEKRNIASEDKSNYKIVRKGDIPYNSMRMWQGAVGNSEYDGIVSPAYTVLVPTDEANAKFFMEYFKKENSLQLFQRWSQGLTSDTWNLKYPTLSSMRFSMPSIEEQNRIASYFEQLDHLITLHQHKCDEMKKLKKCMLQKMFPQNGKKVPEIRFEGFTNDWEQRKFSELYKKVNEKNIFRFGVDKIISVANMYFKEDVKKPNDEYMRTYNIMRLGDIAFEGNKSKNFSHGRFVENTIGDGIVSHVFDVFRPVMDYDLLFWKYLINNENVMGRIMTRCTKASTMMTNLVAKDFLNENILVPTIEEQHKIGTYIDKLDHLITLHHRKCIILRKMKVNDWEQRKLGEVFEQTTNFVNLSKDDIELWSLTVEDGLTPKSERYNREFLVKKDTNFKEVRPGDIVYNPMNMTLGAVGYNGMSKSVAISGYYTTMITKDGNDSYYINTWLKSPQAISLYKIYATGSLIEKQRVQFPTLSTIPAVFPKYEEQHKIGCYFEAIDHLITLHHRKRVILKKTKVSDWEQRKLGEVLVSLQNNTLSRADLSNETGIAKNVHYGDVLIKFGEVLDVSEEKLPMISDKSVLTKYKASFLQNGDVIVADTAEDSTVGKCSEIAGLNDEVVLSGLHTIPYRPIEKFASGYLGYYLNSSAYHKQLIPLMQGIKVTSISKSAMQNTEIVYPKSVEEQGKIGNYFQSLDHLITLHHHEEFCTENVLIYIEINKTIQIKEDIMAELESVIEQKLIDQLVYGDSQWTYRADLKTEEDLWNNFRYILVQNNKDRLNGEPLSDTEFEQVKNQLQFSSFYKAGEWLVGENGKVMVHVQRDTERLHLVVMNHEHIAGGSSVYEVINQYRALADEESQTKAQDRRFDVTLMINGLPMIHIELKNKQHSYMDGFWQIKKYIGEGKFTGIFSAVQMFVISNGVDTKYFSAASDTELNSKFISGWLDNENNPVPDYLDFAKSVLRIPEAHEMIARYTVLDEEAKRLILLRPYQIHAIEAIREASKTGKSGFVWHTTGSGKTLTSYKATRNLLMDIPSIDKAIFLIDRKDLDTQTSMAFRTYANNDLVDVDQTDNVFDLKKKLKSDDRQMIVTTIQKLQRLITKKLAEGTPEYNKIKSLKIAFVVDECHRAVTPGTKRELERFFANSLWYGFTGTPRFAENPYPQLGDLPRTTEELYGERLHRYTIQNAIHDNAVLGFQVEHNGPKNMDDETDSSMYENETHMLRVLDVILNKSYHKLGFQNGKGKTYEGLLTTSSIQLAQKYYELLKRVKNGETELQIDEKVKQILPDFPKFAITYSVTENEEGSHLNQEKMKESINDYNEMFGTKLDISQIQSYNANLNKRLARKEPKFQSRSEQLDLVIVVDRLLTGFDAPCMSTLFVDRQPMGPHDLIQAFSRTNRIFDKNKTYGQIVTFQAPKLFKECVDNAVKLYSAGSTEIALLAEWEEIEPAFRKALKALRVSAETPAEIPVMSEKEKVLFVKAFQHFDKLFAQLKSFTQYEDSMLTEYGISEDEYDDYAGHYLNVKEELKAGAEDTQSEMEEQPIDVDYELMAYSNTKIDYEYIINLIQNIVTPDEDVEITPEERQKQLEEVKQYIDDLRKENPKVADIMSTLVSEIEQDEVKYKGQSILNIVENMKHECIEKVVMDFSITWYVSKDDVMYAATHYRNGEIPNESAIKSTADFTSFKEAQERAIPKFKYYNMMIEELRKTLEEEIKPLLNN